MQGASLDLFLLFYRTSIIHGEADTIVIRTLLLTARCRDIFHFI